MDWQLVARYFTVKSTDFFTVCAYLSLLPIRTEAREVRFLLVFNKMLSDYLLYKSCQRNQFETYRKRYDNVTCLLGSHFQHFLSSCDLKNRAKITEMYSVLLYLKIIDISMFGLN